MPLPETEIPGRLQAELMSRGLRMTRQRRTILSVVETAKQHLDASQLLRRARRLDPQIDRVTVYRTLGLLKRHGLIDELDLMHMQGEKHFYERRPQRDHIHMACLRCGKDHGVRERPVRPSEGSDPKGLPLPYRRHPTGSRWLLRPMPHHGSAQRLSLLSAPPRPAAPMTTAFPVPKPCACNSYSAAKAVASSCNAGATESVIAD